jgi:tripartite-type tricarboxylate transporter receptor subunit TctC
MKKTGFVLCVLALFCCLAAGSACAENWPSKPITAIVPWAAGGMTDVTARLLAEKLKEKLGQPVIVSNMGGAGGITGMRAIMSAKADGYTIGSGAISSAFSSPYFLDSPPLDLNNVDFIGEFALQERLIFAPVGKPYKTWPEFVDYVKKNPGTLSVGFGGNQLSIEIVKSLMKKEGMKLKLVMFKSGGEASTAMLGAHIDMVETGSGTPAYQAARDGKLLPIVNLGSSKDPHFPQLKNMNDLGSPFSATSDYGMVVPAGVPEPIRAKLEQALKDVLDDPGVKDTLFNMGLNRQFLPGKEYREVVFKMVESIPKLAEYVKDVQ